MHGQGEWRWTKLADDLESFIWGVSILYQVIHSEFHGEVVDETYFMKEEVVERLRVLLRQHLPDDLVANWLLYVTT